MLMEGERTCSINVKMCFRLKLGRTAVAMMRATAWNRPGENLIEFGALCGVQTTPRTAHRHSVGCCEARALVVSGRLSLVALWRFRGSIGIWCRKRTRFGGVCVCAMCVSVFCSGLFMALCQYGECVVVRHHDGFTTSI